MNREPLSSDLQSQMRQARRNLELHSQEMVRRARAELNWRSIIAKHPLLALGTAATAGFLLAPRCRCYCRHTDAGTARPAMGSAGPPPATSTVSRLSSAFFSAATAMLAREGASLAAGLAMRWLNSRAEHRESETKAYPHGPRTMSNGAGK